MKFKRRTSEKEVTEVEDIEFKELELKDKRHQEKFRAKVTVRIYHDKGYDIKSHTFSFEDREAVPDAWEELIAASVGKLRDAITVEA